MQKIIKDSEFVPVQVNNLVLDSTVTAGSFNAPTSDAVATAIAEGGSSYSAGDGIAIANDVISARVDGSTVEISDGKIAVKSRPRYTTRSIEVTWLPNSITVNDGESVLYNVYSFSETASISIYAPEGTTDAQVIITKMSGYFRSSNIQVRVGGVAIPIINTRTPIYSINQTLEYGVLKTTAGECSPEIPTTFDEVELVPEVVTNVDLTQEPGMNAKIVIQIVGQVALVFAE